MSRKTIPILTQQVTTFASSTQFETRLSAAKVFWSLASKLVSEPITVQHEACMAVLPVITPLVTETDEIKVPVLKGIRDLCQILTLHEFLIRQGVLDVLINTVEVPQTKKTLEACLFCLSALAGNNNESAATRVAAHVLTRLVKLLSIDSQTVVANVLALINVLALYRSVVPLLHAEPGLVSRVLALQDEVGPVRTNAAIAKARLVNELKESPIGPNRVRSVDANGEEAPPSGVLTVPPVFDTTPPGSAGAVVALPIGPGAVGSGHPAASLALVASTKDRRSRDTHQRPIKQSDILTLQGKGLSLDQAKRALTETSTFSEAEHYARDHYSDDFEQLAKIHILDAIYGDPPPISLTQQRSLDLLPMQKTSSVGLSSPLSGSPCLLPGDDPGLQRKASIPRVEDPLLRRNHSRDRPDGPPRSKSNESPLQDALQRRDSRRREGEEKPSRAGSGEQRRREPRKVSGEEHNLLNFEGERVANLDKAFESNGKWPDGVVNMHFRDVKASTLPNKKHGNFEVDKKRKEDNMRVAAWLRCYDFEEYSHQFAAQKITYETLLRLTMEDLEQLGVHAFGDRKRLLWQISKDAKRLRSKAKRLESKENVLHIAVLQSYPLNGPETPGFPNKLDLPTERSILCDSFKESGRQIRVRFAPATCDNLLKMLTKGCQALHISGHGDPRNLMLEDGKGGSKELDVATLRHMLELGGNELQFVFISACFSAAAANAFVEAGVHHVIAVQESVQITDTSARSYARHVYMALCLGLPVEKAFAKGQAAVLANGCPKPCCCAHLHSSSCASCPKCRMPMCCAKHGVCCHTVTQCCAPQIPHDESLKFLLLPPTMDHSVKLFEGVNLGDWVNCTPDKIINNLPTIPDHFAGRSKDMFCVVQTILKPSRLTTIVGPAGVGKSALARAAASYVHDRRHFEGGCFLVKLTNCNQVEHIREALARAMEASSKPTPVAAETLHRSVLYVFDDCDEFMSNPESQKLFKDFVQAFLERHAQATVLMTSQQSVGRIDGLTHRILTLGPLHQLDGVALFMNRIPRDFKNSDFGDSGFAFTSLQHLACYPLFQRLKGNPRLIEWCAEMLNHMSLCDLDRCLSIPTGQWPKMSEAARLLLLRIKAFVMVSYRPQPEQGQQRQALNLNSDPQLQQIRQLQSLLGLNSSLSPPLSPSSISVYDPTNSLPIANGSLASPTLPFPSMSVTFSLSNAPLSSANISVSDAVSHSTPNSFLTPLKPSPALPLLPLSGSLPSLASISPTPLSSLDDSVSLSVSSSLELAQRSPVVVTACSSQALSESEIRPKESRNDQVSDMSTSEVSGTQGPCSPKKSASLACPASVKLKNSPPPPSRPPPPTSAASRHKRRGSKPER